VTMPRKQHTNPEIIRAQVHKLIEGGKVRKVMKCGHEDYVFTSGDETKEVCWAYRMPQPAQKEADKLNVRVRLCLMASLRARLGRICISDLRAVIV
jgi:arginine/ornithine N-succinyltransferase beta subunit